MAARISQHALAEDTFERLVRQLQVVCGGCSIEQMVELADSLHDTIRHRRPPESRERPAVWRGDA